MSDIATQEENLPAEVKSQDLMAVIAGAVTDPNTDPDKLHKLLDFQERVMNKQAEIDYNAAMARLQPQLPQIEKTAKAHNSKYAKLESIDQIVRPLYTSEGFSVSYNSRNNEDGSKTYFGTLSHKSGHSKTVEMTLPDDTSGSKNPIQAVASTTSYAQRYLLKMLLNIIEKGEDDDGNAFNMLPIDDAQFEEIQKLIDETQTDTAKFCAHLKINSIKEMPNKIYPKAIQDLKAKQKKMKNDQA